MCAGAELNHPLIVTRTQSSRRNKPLSLTATESASATSSFVLNPEAPLRARGRRVAALGSSRAPRGQKPSGPGFHDNPETTARSPDTQEQRCDMDPERVQMFRERLDNFTVSDYYGLKSPGLTCYLNSVLQVLFMTQGFREQIQRRRGEDAARIDAHLERLFADLRRKKAGTHSITRMLGITDRYEQRDAAEYFENILRLTSPEASKMFRGQLTHKTRCLQCEKGNNSRSNFWVLPLVVEDRTYSVEQGLEAFFKGETVCEDNVMFCNHCSEKREAKIDCEITQSPDVLTLLLKRFSFNSELRRYVKLHCKVDVPQTLRLKSCTYDLYASVHHFGDLAGGHYTAEIKSFETGRWYSFNDDVVKMLARSLVESGNTHVRSRTAYLLMYRKGSTRCEKTNNVQKAAAELDVGAEGRHGEMERRENLLHHHRHLNGRHFNKDTYLSHLNGDLSDTSHNDAGRREQKNRSGEPDEQLKRTVARQRPRKDAVLQIDSGTMKQKSKSFKMRADRHYAPTRQQLDTEPKVHRCNTRETPTLRCEPNLSPREVMMKAHNITRERLDNTVSEAGTKTEGSSAANGVGLISKTDAGAERSKEGRSVKRRTAADADVGNSLTSRPVSPRGHSPPSPSCSRTRTDEPNLSCGACEKTSNQTQRPPCTRTGKKTAGVRSNVRREPWR